MCLLNNNVAPVLISQQQKQKLWRNAVYWLVLLAHPAFSCTPGPLTQQCAAFTSATNQEDGPQSGLRPNLLEALSLLRFPLLKGLQLCQTDKNKKTNTLTVQAE